MFLLISLWATVTNAVPVSIIFVVLTPLFLIALPKNRSLPATAFVVLIMYAYFMLSTAVYAPESFIAPEFYRRDGNVFVTFLPIIIGGLVAVKINLEAVMRRFVIWAGIVNAICLIIYFITGGTIVYEEEGVYHFLFEAHNAAGGYLSMVSAFSLGIYLRSEKGKRSLWLLLVVSNLIGLWLTASRGSVGALLCALIFVLALKERFMKTMILGLAASMMVILLYAYPFWTGAGMPLDLSENTSTETIGSKDANVLQRVLYLWPRALYLFFESPIFGTGYGSYNDIPYRISGIPHVFAFNHPLELSFNSAHAHNTYLHVLGETGAVGLGLVILMLVKMRQSINTMQPASVQLGMKLAFWVAVFSSMTEHRLFTPAQMLPFTIFFGMVLANSRWNRAYVHSGAEIGIPALSR
jgi:O-antigen ligase